jgi:UDP-N-acetyl-D-galactosamine dehydrogenase
VSILFNKLGIDTYEVLRAAKTKWNFNNYYPGMVGGHCIGVDPYYLIHQAKEIGIDMKVMRSAREVNEGIAPLVAEVCSKRIKDKNITEPKILVLGATFKENCSDTRNSKAMELIETLKEKYTVSYFDPYLGIGDEEHLLAHIREYDVVVLAVSHDFFKNIKTKLMLLLEDKIVIDVKGLFKEKLQGTSNYWKL